MNTINILKKLIILYYYLTILGILFIIVGSPIMYYKGIELPINSMENFNVSNLSAGKFISIYIAAIFIYFQFLKALHLFKNSLKDLTVGKYFSELVTNNFKRMGTAFLICGFSFSGFKIILRLALLSDLKLGVDNTLFLLSILGLFFLFLSEVFAKARVTKQENDLTI